MSELTNVAAITTFSANGINHPAVTFKRQLAATNLSFTVETSPDLVNWITGSSYASTGNNPITTTTREVSRGGSPLETITVRDNFPMSSGTNLFMRVRVSRP